MHRVIVVGSPRQNGRCAHLAEALFNACIDECPEDGVSIVSVASTVLSPCTGCDGCARPVDEPPLRPEEDDTLAAHPLVVASDAGHYQCVLEDDMAEVRKHLDAADELIVVSPVYFAGAPAQFKALMDRLQPYYRSNVRFGPRRPMALHVVGEGADPHGFEPLIGTVRSAFTCAGFDLELVLDWVGKIDSDGVIFAEADEYPLPPVGGFKSLVEGDFEFVDFEDFDDVIEFDDDVREFEFDDDDDIPRPASKGERARLSLSDAEPTPKKKPAKDESGRAQAGGSRKGGSGSRKGGSGNANAYKGGKKGGSNSRRGGSGSSGSHKGGKRHG